MHEGPIISVREGRRNSLFCLAMRPNPNANFVVLVEAVRFRINFVMCTIFERLSYMHAHCIIVSMG